MSTSGMDAAAIRSAFRQRCAHGKQLLLDAAAAPEATQAEMLQTFIRRNVDTAFGREHGFERLRTVEDYRRAVPLRDAAGFKPWLDRVAEGEDAVLTAEPTAMFFRTAGTTGPPKRLPATRTAMGTTRGPAMYALWGNFLDLHPELLEHEHATLDIHWDRRPVTETIGSREIPFQSMAQRHALLHPDDFAPPWYDAPWFQPRADVPDYSERLYLKLRTFAPQDVRAIASINPITMHLMAEILARHSERLIDELKRGIGVAANPSLAERLRSVADARGGRLLPQDLWPNVSFLGCRKSAIAALYLPKLVELFGEQATVRPYSTAGAEGSQAIPVDGHDTAGVAALRSTFMEFLPADAPWQADRQTLLTHELELGREYQTVLTTPDGLYRDAIGDIFQVVGFVGPSPQLVYRGRTGRISSMTGESLSEPQVVDAGRLAVERFGLRLQLFTCCPRSTPQPHYVFVMETSQAMADPARVATALDEALAAANAHYREARDSGALASAQVESIAPGTFHDHWFRSVAEGKGTIQLQIHPLQEDDAILRALAQHPCAESSAG